MANTQRRKTYSIIQGGGRVYVNPTASVSPSVTTSAVPNIAANAAASVHAGLMGNLNNAPSGTWKDAGYLDDQGVSLTIGNEMEVITEIESLWPIDARKVSAGAMFRAMLLEATLDNLYELGLSKVGMDLDSNVAATGGGTIDLFSADRFGGPDEHIPGVSLVFDGPAPKGSTSAKRVRRVWLPRVINLTPIDLISSKRGQTMIRLDLTCLLPDVDNVRPCYIADQFVG